jgi:uncharacterized membrane protein HdeD (DUF308 family)
MQIFKDSESDRNYHPKPDKDEVIAANTSLHRIVGSILGTVFFLGGLDYTFGIFRIFTPPGTGSMYPYLIGIFFVGAGILTLAYVHRAARRAQRSIIAPALIFLLLLGLCIGARFR